MMRINRFKKTKQKKQTKKTNKTKHKRRMQYGGKKKTYADYSNILKSDAPQKKVVIPGYAEISDMLLEYKEQNLVQNQLDNGIKSKNVVVYTSCEIPKPDTLPTTIILLRKDSFFSNSSIDCEEDNYLALASHNFKIFIESILRWNPFLPKTHNHEPTQDYGSQLYGSRHSYNTEKFSYLFTNESWWDTQAWWNAYKKTLGTYATLVPAPTLQPPPPPPPIRAVHDTYDKDAEIRVLKIHVDGLNKRVSDLTKENQDLRKQILTMGETKKDR